MVGGMDGQRTDYVRWYPPDTPFLWGQGFGMPFSNVAAINGGRWPQTFLPDPRYMFPYGMSQSGYMFPVVGGSSGGFQAQMVVGTPGQQMTAATAIMAEQHAAARATQPGSLMGLAGGFGRS